MSKPMNYKEWLEIGISQGFLGHKYCTTHLLSDAECCEQPTPTERKLIMFNLETNQCVTFIHLMANKQGLGAVIK